MNRWGTKGRGGREGEGWIGGGDWTKGVTVKLIMDKNLFHRYIFSLFSW